VETPGSRPPDQAMTTDTSSNAGPACLHDRPAVSQRRIRRGAASESRRRIVAAAQALIREDGLDRLDVAHVCDRAEVPIDVFHASFDALEPCLLGVFDLTRVEAGAAMADAYRAADGWANAVRGALAALLDYLDERPRLARFAIVGSLLGDAAMLARRRQTLECLADALEAGRPAPLAGPLPTPLGGHAVVGAVAAVLHGRLAEDPVPPLRELCAPLMSMIVLPYLDVDAAVAELRHET
jgi:AcrR family transcriptional regulator